MVTIIAHKYRHIDSDFDGKVVNFWFLTRFQGTEKEIIVSVSASSQAMMKVGLNPNYSPFIGGGGKATKASQEIAVTFFNWAIDALVKRPNNILDNIKIGFLEENAYIPNMYLQNVEEIPRFTIELS